jgi:hypothetical protein
MSEIITMPDIQEFYILGLPINNKIGICHFLKVKEYPSLFGDLQLLTLTKEQLIYKYSELNKNNMLNEFIDELKKLSLFEIATGLPELQQSYYKIFTKIFNGEEALHKINEENFDYYRKLIMTMNCMKEEVINPNPEIQKAIERSKRVKQQDGDNVQFSDIVTSLVGYNGLTYDDINEFSVYQLYMTYYRIAQFKNYDTTTLFATVSSDKIKIDSWSKHINIFEEEKHFVTRDEFDQKSDGLFGNK